MLWGWIPTFYTHSCSTYWDAASHHREVSVSLQCLWCLHFTWKPQERFENLSLACVGSNISLSHAHIHMPLETGWIIFFCVCLHSLLLFFMVAQLDSGISLLTCHPQLCDWCVQSLLLLLIFVTCCEKRERLKQWEKAWHVKMEHLACWISFYACGGPDKRCISTEYPAIHTKLQNAMQ